MRILHVLGGLNRGGIETWLRHALVHLPRDRYECAVCTYRFLGGSYAAELEQRGCQLYFIPRGRGPFALFRFSKEFRRLLRENQYDAVHCHGLLLVGFLLFLAWLERVPVRIGHSHNTDRRTGDVLALVSNRIGLILNRALARSFSTHGVGCSAEAAAALFGDGWTEKPNYSIIHCGIDLAPFELEGDVKSWRETLRIQPDQKVIGHVSNFGLAKNPVFLVEVAAAVFRRRQDVVLLLVGDGALRSAMEQRCMELGVSSRVIFAGTSSHIPEIMRSAMDVFLMPSLHEGLPLVLLEAQAAGLPCLVSDVVSQEVTVADGSVQFLSLAGGVEAWTDAVLSLLEKPLRRPDLPARMVNSDFNVVVSAARLDDLYRETQIAPRDSSPAVGTYSAKV